MIVSGLGWWSAGLVILKLGLRPSFIPNSKLWFALDSDEGALDLSIWSRHFRVIFHDKLWSFPDLDAGTLDLSFWSGALAQLRSWFQNYDFSGLWWWPRWGIGLFILMPTCHLKLGLRPSFILNNKWWVFLDLDDEALDLSIVTNYDCFLWPSFIFNDKS